MPSFQEVARLPFSGDNAAIAVRRLEAGDGCLWGERRLLMSHTVMEGHRFAVRPVAAGEPLLSWGLPFGRALRPLRPGEYLCNQGMLDALAQRPLNFSLPAQPNFEDWRRPYVLPEDGPPPAQQVERCADTRPFAGYVRPGGRGVGTRNYIVVLGTSACTAALARVLAARMAPAAQRCAGVDGVVPVEHTEGGGGHVPHNLELVLRTLAGFCVHPNVAGFVALDYGDEPVTNARLAAYAAQHGYPLEAVPHAFLSVREGVDRALDAGARQIVSWLGREESAPRRDHSMGGLRIALQCGGSDAFSGISGNPLAAWVAREIVRRGGSANLAETDELMGAESYVLQKVRDRATAVRFLEMGERFSTRMAWHGESPEDNPSAGNKYRGLYNISLKSLGAARKRDPQVRLDGCLEYGEPMPRAGFYFMDSPGNDLESIAGQVAAGCNLILFVTGNGSVTNFPFVPTLKIVTTTARYELLGGDMDVDAGAFLTGTPMDVLGSRTLERVRAVAGGARTCGEQAGHAQVQLWREWPQSDGTRLAALRARPRPRARALDVQGESPPAYSVTALRGPAGPSFDQVGLVIPASLCAAQVAVQAARRLEGDPRWKERGVRRFVALPHTEGCGATTDELTARVLVSYLRHPAVRAAVVLEHGCEKVHNDYLRARAAERGLDPQEYGWASVQQDGGSVRALGRVEELFDQLLGRGGPAVELQASLSAVRVGILASGPVPEAAGAALARIVRWIHGAGGTVLLPEGMELPGMPGSGDGVRAGDLLPWGACVPGPGVYAQEMPTDQWLERLTGMVAGGADVVLAYAGRHPLQGHPLVPVVQTSAAPEVLTRYGPDLDVPLRPEARSWAEDLLEALCAVLSRKRTCRAWTEENVGLQVTRGLLGISV